MSSSALTIQSLAVTWPLALAGLAVLRRLTSRAGTYLPQTALCGVGMLAMNGVCLWGLLAGREDRWGWIILALALGACFWYVVFQVVNVAVCSIRARMLLELLDMPTGSGSVHDLESRLCPADAVQQRIERLVQWREIREHGGRYVLTGRRFLTLNAVLDVWRRILGLPTSAGADRSRG